MSEKNSESNNFFTDNENKQKRNKQIKNLCSYLKSIKGENYTNRNSEIDYSNLNKEDLERIFSIIEIVKLSENEDGSELLEESFNKYLYELKYPSLDIDDTIIEVFIRYSLIYLEDFNYDLKLKGVDLIDFLLNNLTSSKLLVNMRSSLIYETLLKYINDKDSIIFLSNIIRVMCFLLNKMETKYGAAEHLYKKHSFVLDSLLNSCYLSTSFQIKTIYLNSFQKFLQQMNHYSFRHLEKYFTISFDFIESIQVMSFNDDINENLLKEKFDYFMSSIDLTEMLVKVCEPRMHAHARRILNFCVKILYFYSVEFQESNIIVEKVINVIRFLFKNERVKSLFYEEFKSIGDQKSIDNQNVIKLIKTI